MLLDDVDVNTLNVVLHSSTFQTLIKKWRSQPTIFFPHDFALPANVIMQPEKKARFKSLCVADEPSHSSGGGGLLMFKVLSVRPPVL